MTSYKKAQIQKIVTYLVAVPIACLEYGVYFNYLSQPFIRPGYYIGNVLEGQLMSKYMAAHAIICLCVALATAIIVRRKVKLSVWESSLYFVACACIILPLSAFCAGLARLLAGLIVAITLVSSIPVPPEAIFMGEIHLFTFVGYLGGLIISSRLCTRTAKDMSKREDSL
jgi:hypothetical protein